MNDLGVHPGKLQQIANNATIAVLSRLTAIIGVPLAGYIGVMVLSDIRDLKRDFAAQNTSIAVMQTERTADRQEIGDVKTRVGRLEDTVYFRPAIRNTLPGDIPSPKIERAR